MKLALVAAFLSSVALAVAQVTINTPIGPISCLNQQVTFSGGSAPYTMQVQLFGQGTAPALNTYTGISGSPFTWLVEQGPGTSVFLRLRDANGATGETGRIDVQPGGPYPCSGSTSGAATGSTPANTGSTSAAPGTTETTPSSPTSPSTSAGGSGSGSTPGTTTTRSTSSSASSTPNAAISLNAAGGAVLGLAGLVAAALA